jgi:hypothetical protein
MVVFKIDVNYPLMIGPNHLFYTISDFPGLEQTLKWRCKTSFMDPNKLSQITMLYTKITYNL